MRIVEVTEPNIIETIKKDCKPFLQLINGDIMEYTLWRGMLQALPAGIQRKDVRLDDREPLSSNPSKHEKFNNYFERAFGAPFRNSAHCTGKRKIAKMYGMAYVVFPIGKFDWVWSPKVADLTMDIVWPTPGGWTNVPPSQEVVDEKLSKAGYTKNKNLKAAIKSGNEIMIRCKEYYAVEPERLGIEKV